MEQNFSLKIRNKSHTKYEILGGGEMNKKTVALTEEQYKNIIETIRNGFVCADGHIVKPNKRISVILSLLQPLTSKLVKLLQPENALNPMSVTPLGILILPRLLQP